MLIDSLNISEASNLAGLTAKQLKNYKARDIWKHSKNKSGLARRLLLNRARRKQKNVKINK
jgi:hypothetical protein